MTDVDPDSDAADRGFKGGERIVSINNRKVTSPAEAGKVLNEARKDGRKRSLFQLEANGCTRFVALPIDQA